MMADTIDKDLKKKKNGDTLKDVQITKEEYGETQEKYKKKWERNLIISLQKTMHNKIEMSI